MNSSTLFAFSLALSMPLQCFSSNVDIDVRAMPGNILVGERSFVDLVGTYDGTDRILGGAISLSFRADLIEVVGVTLKAPSDIAGSTGSVLTSGANGVVDGIGFASFAGVTGTFSLATIEFRALGTIGNSWLSAFDPGDPVFVWVNEAIQPVTVTSMPITLTVSAVPEPATYAMALVGLVIGVALGRRSKRLNSCSEASRRAFRSRPCAAAN